jgi:hypothetical protein
MPPTSEPPTNGGQLGFAGLPDRDNPLAWKRKTEAGRQGARLLLAELTDEEVARYMSVASDQMRIEERHRAVKIFSALMGGALVVGCLWYGLAKRFEPWDIAGLGLGVAMGYWPWRVVRCRQLWQQHFDAAQAEQVRRLS